LLSKHFLFVKVQNTLWQASFKFIVHLESWRIWFERDCCCISQLFSSFPLLIILAWPRKNI
jgi:hypothetical protein